MKIKSGAFINKGFDSKLDELMKISKTFSTWLINYQIEETDNSNILLRSEVLNKLNNKRNTIIVSYPDAIFEKVVSRRVLKQKTNN